MMASRSLLSEAKSHLIGMVTIFGQCLFECDEMKPTTTGELGAWGQVCGVKVVGGQEI